MKNIGKKIGAFMQLMEISTRRPTLLTAKATESENAAELKQLKIQLDDLIDEYVEKQWDRGDWLFLPWSFECLSYTPNDWYFLVRLAMYTHNDKEVGFYPWNDGEYRLFVGSNLRTLLHAIENDYF